MNQPVSLVAPLPEPWPEPVDGGELLDALEGMIRRYLYLPEGASVALALWVVHTFAFDAAEHSPILFATSPQKGCGKTTLLRVLRALTRQAILSANLTPAVIYRVVQAHRPTLLIDEADTFLSHRDELVGILNSGHQRDGVVLRTEKLHDGCEVRSHSTWSPKSIAAIGTIAAPLLDRSIVLSLRKRPRQVTLERFTASALEESETLQRKTLRWVLDNIASLRVANPPLPDSLGDRAKDNWRPLMAIAQRVSPEWTARANLAALGLSGDSDSSLSAGELALSDLKRYFDETSVDRVSTDRLLTWLTDQEERPWADYHGPDRQITASDVAKLLGLYGIRPKKYREGQATRRGYLLDRHTVEQFDLYVAPNAEHPEHDVPVVADVPPNSALEGNAP